MKQDGRMHVSVHFSSEEEKRRTVRQGEEAFSARLTYVTDALLTNTKLRLIGLCGPTCAGKTTAANRISAAFAAQNRRVHIISVDDFYYDKDVLHTLSQQRGNGEIDYDSPETIDIQALSAFVRAIGTGGGELECPTFDFGSGMRKAWRSISYGERDVFLLEGIQVVYPQVLSLLEPYGFVGVYIAPLQTVCYADVQIPPNTLRLMRRLVRDARYRSTSPEFTLRLWQSVRQNEEKWIFPHVDRFPYHLDSTFPYEVGILKPYLDQLLAGVRGREAEEIRHLLQGADGIDPSYLASDSLYHEFV